MRTLTPRQKRFCELVVEGRTYTEAYARSYGGTGHGARSKASRLGANANIQRHIAMLRKPLLVESLLGLEQKRRLLAEIVKTDVVSLIDDAGGIDMQAVLKLPPHVIESVTVAERRHRDGSMTRTVSVKLPDKLRAMEVDNMLAGHGGGHTLSNEADDESLEPARAEAVARARAIIKRLHERKTMPTSIVVEHSS